MNEDEPIPQKDTATRLSEIERKVDQLWAARNNPLPWKEEHVSQLFLSLKKYYADPSARAVLDQLYGLVLLDIRDSPDAGQPANPQP